MLSNFQPESCTASASSSINRWYSSQPTHRFLSSLRGSFIAIMVELFSWIQRVDMQNGRLFAAILGFTRAQALCSDLERMTQQNRFVAIRTCRHHVDRHARYFLDPRKILARG